VFFFDPSGQFINSNYLQRFDPRFEAFSSAETLCRFMSRNTQQYQYHDIASRPHQSKRYYIQIRDNINNDGLTSKQTLQTNCKSISNNFVKTLWIIWINKLARRIKEKHIGDLFINYKYLICIFLIKFTRFSILIANYCTL